MPNRPPHPCVVPGCAAVVRGTSRCTTHETERHQRIDARRGSARDRGYDAAWERLRRSVLAEHPLCAFCAERGHVTAATVVDHIISLRQAPALRLVETNLRALCKPCHDARTMREQVGRRRARAPTMPQDRGSRG